jgi:CheY-like chemotaxis protein
MRPENRLVRVLITDDNVDSADALATLLRLMPCEVAVAYHGAAALPLAEQFKPDVCILDIRMPGQHGLEIARRLRAWARGERLLLIAYTGSQDTRDAALAAGFNHFILKPGNTRELVSCLETFARGADASVACAG